MSFFTSIFRDTVSRQLLLFLALSLGLLAAFAAWNQGNWTPRQSKRFAAASLEEKIALLFENGNISPEISRLFYRIGISVRPRYVVVGKEGWMYLGDKYEEVASRAARGIPELDRPLLARWSGQLRQRQDWLESRGVRSLFAIAPNKHAIYPEYGPSWLPFADHGTANRLVAAASEAGVNIVDTSPAIREQKCCLQWLYNRTDTHWTYPAAFIGYRAVMESLQGDLAVLSEDDVVFSPKDYPGGGLSNLLGFSTLYDAPFDPGYDVAITRPAGGFCIVNIQRDFSTRGRCEPRADTGVLAGAMIARQVENPRALNDLSVLMVEDSFGYAASRFFNHSFKRVWHAHVGFILNGERLRQFVARFQPDIVVFLLVERNLLRPLYYEFDGASGLAEAPIE